MKRKWTTSGVLFVAALFANTAFASLSDNLIPNGDFEDFSTTNFVGGDGDVLDWSWIKSKDSPRSESEVSGGTPPVRAWQFHADYDLGRWIGPWGSSAGDGGITTWDDPRAAYLLGESVYTQNISIDPLNPGNHVLDGVAFRTCVGIFLPAPEHHVAGPATIDFDYYWNNWTGLPPGTAGTDAASIFSVVISGVHEADLPTPLDRYSPDADLADWGPSGADLLWYSPNWSEWGWTGPGSDEPAITSLGDQWNDFSDDHPDRATFDIAQTYDYYYMEVYQIMYSELHPYFFIYGGRPTDSFALGVDNIDLRVSVTPPLVPGDFDRSGIVDTQDINPFILGLTNIQGWMNQYLLPGEDAGEVMCGLDINGDCIWNTEDINPFIGILTGGGEATIIPEPASLAVLLCGAAGLMRRRG